MNLLFTEALNPGCRITILNLTSIGDSITYSNGSQVQSCRCKEYDLYVDLHFYLNCFSFCLLDNRRYKDRCGKPIKLGHQMLSTNRKGGADAVHQSLLSSRCDQPISALTWHSQDLLPRVVLSKSQLTNIIVKAALMVQIKALSKNTIAIARPDDETFCNASI